MSKHKIKGFVACAVKAGIKYKDRLDLGIVKSLSPARAAGVFTKNRVAAAPVILGRKNLRAGACSVIIANSGNANACTGARGLRDAELTAKCASEELGCPAKEVVVSSTGVIGVPLPVEKIRRGLKGASALLRENGFDDFSRAIMTTDSFPKIVMNSFAAGKSGVNLMGIAKGAGMIAPDMATMLCYIFTDGAITSAALRSALGGAVDSTFNRITVDGDMSTNDTVLLLASGASGAGGITPGSTDYRKFSAALGEVCAQLSRMMVRDGEGATKTFEVRVSGAPDAASAKAVAFRVANSPLVKTAVYGMDMNWGRLIGAAGATGARFDPDRIDIYIDSVKIVSRGISAGKSAEDRAGAIFREKKHFSVTFDLHAGKYSDRVLTCDLSHKYIDINASYRT